MKTIRRIPTRQEREAFRHMALVCILGLLMVVCYGPGILALFAAWWSNR